MIFLAWGVLAQDYVCDGDTCITNGKFNVNGDQASVGGNLSITPIGTGCPEQWSCSCVSGVTQCVDANACGTTNTIPASQGQSCTVGGNNGGGSSGGGSSGGGGDGTSGNSGGARISECVELWQCEDWKECDDGKQTRNCRDLSQCGTSVLKPSIERECASAPELKINGEDQKTSGLLGAFLGALGNLGKSKIAIIIIFIALVIAASLIISAVRSAPSAPGAGESLANADEVKAPKEGKK